MTDTDSSPEISDDLMPERRATGFLTFPREHYLLFAGLDAATYTFTLAAVLRWLFDVDLVKASSDVLPVVPVVDTTTTVSPVVTAGLLAGIVSPLLCRAYLGRRFPDDVEVPKLSLAFMTVPFPLAVYLTETVSSAVGYTMLLYLGTYFALVIYDTFAPEQYRLVTRAEDDG